MRAYEYLIPSLSVQKWVERGVNLGNKDAADTYKTDQIRHFHKKNNVCHILVPQYILNFLLSNLPKVPKDISFIYKQCNQSLLEKKSNSMLRWEKELNQIFSLTQWFQAIKVNSRSSECTEHWDNFQKIFHR